MNVFQELYIKHYNKLFHYALETNRRHIKNKKIDYHGIVLDSLLDAIEIGALEYDEIISILRRKIAKESNNKIYTFDEENDHTNRAFSTTSFCYICNEDKPFAAFYEVHYTYGIRASRYCKNCIAQRVRDKRHGVKLKYLLPASQRSKMSLAKIGHKHPKFSGYYVVNGVKYGSSYLAHRETGINYRTVQRRCKKGVDGFLFIPIIPKSSPESL